MNYIQSVNQGQNREQQDEYQQLMELKQRYVEYQEQISELSGEKYACVKRIKISEENISYYCDPLRYFGKKKTIIDSVAFKIFMVFFFLTIKPIFIDPLILIACGGIAYLGCMALEPIMEVPAINLFVVVGQFSIPVGLLFCIVLSIIGIIASVGISVLCSYNARAKRKYKKDKKIIEKELSKQHGIVKEENEQIAKLEEEMDQISEEFYNIPSIIDPSDYKYLDYIFYLFDTKRVFCVKEALQCVDMEKRTGSILSSLTKTREELAAKITYVGKEIQRMNLSVTSATNAVRNEVEKSNIQMEKINSRLQSIDVGLYNIDEGYSYDGKSSLESLVNPSYRIRNVLKD